MRLESLNYPVFAPAEMYATMSDKQVPQEQLLLEIERLRQELESLKKEKTDLEILLETTTDHADTVESLMHELNQQLQAEILERQRVEIALQASEAELQSLLARVTRDKNDLEIILETTTQHGDTVENLLHDQALEVVKESQKRLTQFLEAVPVGITVVDAAGKPYYANRLALQLLGKEFISSVDPHDFSDFYQCYIAGTDQPYPPENLPILRALKGESSTASDIEIRCNNEVIPIEVWGTPIFDEQGNITYAIAAFKDVTERRKAEVERQKFTNELFQLNGSLEKALDAELELTEAYSRFVPHEFLYFLGYDSIVDVKLGDQVQLEMSVLFADIRDFTTLSETMTPEENFRFINAYLSRMEPTIIQNNGFIDKYIGDAIMALFSGDADDAVQAAVAMLNVLTEYNEHRANVGYVPIKIGVGIHTGSLMLGTVGGQNRMDSTVISDTVNLAARLENLTKNYGVSLLISHETFWRLEKAHQYGIRFIEPVQVKGKSKTVSIFEVFDADPPEIRDGKFLTKTQFEEAIILYHQQQWRQAAILFQECLYRNPLDQVAKMYLERCKLD